jgi:hypothetical protein
MEKLLLIAVTIWAINSHAKAQEYSDAGEIDAGSAAIASSIDDLPSEQYRYRVLERGFDVYSMPYEPRYITGPNTSGPVYTARDFDDAFKPIPLGLK